MTNEQIIEGNKLIAEFDGWVLTIGNFAHAFNGKEDNAQETKRRNRLIGFDDCIDNEDLKYHSSWDWLMPVAKKISDMRKEGGGELNGKVFDLIHMMFHEVLDNTPSKLWVVIVEFIKWHNSYQNTAA